MTEKTYQNEARWLLHEKYNGFQTAEYYADLERIKKGEPVAYIIGYSDFLDCKIDLSFRPLIPRTETEFLIERAISEIKKNKLEVMRIADTFSGSGCIGIAIAHHIPSTIIDFIEINPFLVKQIEMNVRLNNINPQRIRVFHGDTLEPLEGSYHAIFANPPYISRENRDTVEPSVYQHEPHQALFASDNGMYYIKKIIDEGFSLLTEGGSIYIECDPHQKELLENYLKKRKWKYEFWTDQYERTRFLVLRK